MSWLFADDRKARGVSTVWSSSLLTTEEIFVDFVQELG